ncbi:wunen isoform X1 [Cotesia typhae]|uniref:wunen isoform X1 n=1 Tax=Cotesia typhae TaxID=2053667 RepID=UPI003D69F346
MDRSSKLLLVKIIIDFTCVTVVGFTVLGFYLFGQPYQRGFFCNDESLMHPYRESTVTNTMLYIVGIFLPICVILCGEFLYAKNTSGQSSVVLFGRVIPRWVVLAYHKIGSFAFGAVANVLTTDVAKYAIGRLRPHFIELCKPSINCSLPINHHKFIEHDQFTCTASNVTKRLLKEVRLSFPSGHSSFSTYVMIYLVLYLQLRITWKGSVIFKHFVQLILILLAWATAMSRVSDYKHHWSDVLVGMLIGVIVSLITVFGIADLFKERRESGITNAGHGDKSRAMEYDAETAMQDESRPLKNLETSYGGLQITQQHSL